MQLYYYHFLREDTESVSLYKKRLESFAIFNRIDRARNYVYVAEQIVKRNLTSQFKHYQLPA